MKYKLKKISRQQKVSKSSGKPYESVGIQVAEFGETWINGFGNKGNENWKEGDEVNLNIVDHEYNGKVTKQFEMIKETSNPASLRAFDQLDKYIQMRIVPAIQDLEKRVKALEGGDLEYPEYIEPTI